MCQHVEIMKTFSLSVIQKFRKIYLHVFNRIKIIVINIKEMTMWSIISITHSLNKNYV